MSTSVHNDWLHGDNCWSDSSTTFDDSDDSDYVESGSDTDEDVAQTTKREATIGTDRNSKAKERTPSQQKSRNRNRRRQRSRKRRSALGDASRNKDGNKTCPKKRKKTTTKRSGRKKGGSDIVLRLERKPLVDPGQVSIGLLKTAFPRGASIRWPSVSTVPNSDDLRQSTTAGREKLPVDDAMDWLLAVSDKDNRAEMTKLETIQEMIHFTASAVGAFTAFVLRCTVNRRESIKTTGIWIPRTRIGETANDKDDDKYSTCIVVIPQAGVFFSDYGVAPGHKTPSLVPLPLEWLGLYDQRAVPAKAFVKRILPGHHSIMRVVWKPRTHGAMGTCPLSCPIGAIQLHDRDHYTPLIPPNLFLGPDGKGHGGGIQERASLQEQRDQYNATLMKSRTNYAHCRRYVKGSRHTETSDNISTLLDHRKIGDFDIRIEVKDMKGVSTHTSYIRVRKATQDVADAIVAVGRVKATRVGNARVQSGDGGKMFATGCRFRLLQQGGVQAYVIKNTNGIVELLQRLNTAAIQYLRASFNELLSVFHRFETIRLQEGVVGETAITHSKNDINFITPSMNFTVNLWNASHVDVNDGSYSVGIWASDDGTDVENWELILPNVSVVSIDGQDVGGGGGGVTTQKPDKVSKGTRIRLFHGCAVSWEGTKIRHCTSRVADETIASQNRTYSCFWCSSAKQHKMACDVQKLKKEPKLK